jgi:hypothetical protein
MIALTIIVLSLALAPALKNRTDNARNLTTEEGEVNGLDCSNSSISSFDKVTCTSTDLTLFVFIGGMIFIAGAVATAKIIFN